MRPSPIPNHEIPPGATRSVFAAPDGDLTRVPPFALTVLGAPE